MVFPALQLIGKTSKFAMVAMVNILLLPPNNKHVFTNYESSLKILFAVVFKTHSAHISFLSLNCYLDRGVTYTQVLAFGKLQVLTKAVLSVIVTAI